MVVIIRGLGLIFHGQFIIDVKEIEISFSYKCSCKAAKSKMIACGHLPDH